MDESSSVVSPNVNVLHETVDNLCAQLKYELKVETMQSGGWPLSKQQV